MKPDVHEDHEDASDAMRALHRDASARLDEAPDPAVRMAVFAAAARAVDAKPRDTRTGSTNPFRTRRWPLSAAALLVVSVMTGLIAGRALHDDPERVTSIARREVPASSPGIAKDEARPAPAVDAQVEAAKAPQAVAPKPAAAAKPRPPARPAPTVEAEAFVAPPAPAPAPPEAVASASRSSGAPAAADASSARNEPTASGTDQPLVKASALSAPLARVQSLRNREGVEPTSPEAWVARIVALRAAGNEDEAERELKALRARYPGFEIPATALGPTGSR